MKLSLDWHAGLEESNLPLSSWTGLVLLDAVAVLVVLRLAPLPAHEDG